jgi:hypothetical protein
MDAPRSRLWAACFRHQVDVDVGDALIAVAIAELEVLAALLDRQRRRYRPAASPSSRSSPCCSARRGADRRDRCSAANAGAAARSGRGA